VKVDLESAYREVVYDCDRTLCQKAIQREEESQRITHFGRSLSRCCPSLWYRLGVEGEPRLVDDFRKNLPLNALCNLIRECDTWDSASILQHFGSRISGKPGIVLVGQVAGISLVLLWSPLRAFNLLQDRANLHAQPVFVVGLL